MLLIFPSLFSTALLRGFLTLSFEELKENKITKYAINGHFCSRFWQWKTVGGIKNGLKTLKIFKMSFPSNLQYQGIFPK